MSDDSQIIELTLDESVDILDSLSRLPYREVQESIMVLSTKIQKVIETHSQNEPKQIITN